ncbi:MAG: hypothetical protein RLZZ450_3268 [Pseudomonadota bacterium]|jgi:flagellar biosynthesis protein FlhB
MSEAHAARPHPPSSRRSAEARAQGHVPRAPLAGPIFVLLSLIASVWALGPRAFRLCTSLLREPLELAARGASVPARERALFLLRELSVVCAPALVVVVVSVALGLFVVQGPAFVSSRGRGTSFPALAISRTASALWCAGVLLIVLLALSQWASFELRTLGASATAWAGQLAALSVGTLLVDVAFARARFYASLWLTRHEHLDEQRAALGPPDVRAARERERLLLSRASGPASTARAGAGPQAGT